MNLVQRPDFVTNGNTCCFIFEDLVMLSISMKKLFLFRSANRKTILDSSLSILHRGWPSKSDMYPKTGTAVPRLPLHGPVPGLAIQSSQVTNRTGRSVLQFTTTKDDNRKSCTCRATSTIGSYDQMSNAVTLNVRCKYMVISPLPAGMKTLILVKITNYPPVNEK